MSAERKKSEGVTAPGHIAATKSATAQRRHELEQNTLAETLQKVKLFFTEGFSRSTWIVLGIVAAAVLLYFIWRFFAHSSDDKNSELTVKLQLLMEGESLSAKEGEKALIPRADPEKEFTEFAKANAGTVQARIAEFRLARLRLTRGELELGSPNSRRQALESIAKAAKDYEKLQGESSDVPLLHQEALLRAGQARECLGEFDKAQSNYEKLISEYKNKDKPNEFVKAAEEAVERLKDPTKRKVLEELARTYTKEPGS